MSSTMIITDFLDAHGILWQPINLSITDGKKTPSYVLDYMPKMTDFAMLDPEVLQERKQHLALTQFIAIDTRVVYQIDVDKKEGMDDGLRELMTQTPYFLSVTKKLPHIFVQIDKKLRKKREQTTKDGVELLCGQWSYCAKDTMVYNCAEGIASFPDASGMVQDSPAPAPARAANGAASGSGAGSADIASIRQMVALLSDRRADCYDDWIRLGWCLFNIDKGLLPVWKEFSQRSDKYSESECDTLWSHMTSRGRGEALTEGSLRFWCKSDNPRGYDALLKERLQPHILACTGAHNSVAQIAAMLLKHEFVCGTVDSKMWYRFDGTRWVHDDQGIVFGNRLSKALRNTYISAQADMLQALSIDDLQSDSVASARKKANRIITTALNLQQHYFKEAVKKEAREYLYDPAFMQRLDSKPNLICFANGVYDLETKQFRPGKPEDYLSLSVGYDYVETKNEDMYSMVQTYFETLHPYPEQREYMVKTEARQLYGDSGRELFHFHAGLRGSAANGKTKSFQIKELVYGDYISKFDVGILVNEKRSEFGKPIPEKARWKGKRFLYCTEPNEHELINSGVMKDMTGGETVVYRLLHSNTISQYVPVFKLHIMCNGTPRITGEDEGVRRRVRKVEYVSQFVEEDVDPDRFRFRCDPAVAALFKTDAMKMEYMRYILDHFDMNYNFPMPEVIAASSAAYINDNNDVKNFVDEFMDRTGDPRDVTTLKELKPLFCSSEHCNDKRIKSKDLVVKLERELDDIMHDTKRIDGVTYRQCFVGWKIRDDNADDPDDNTA